MPCGRYIKLDVAWTSTDWVNMLSMGGQLAWVKLLCYCREAGVKGVVKYMSPRTAHDKWKIPARYIEEMYKAAIEDKSIEIDENSIKIVNWEKYQDSSAVRVQRWRDQKKGSPEPSVTLRPSEPAQPPVQPVSGPTTIEPNTIVSNAIETGIIGSDTRPRINTEVEPDVTLCNGTESDVTLQNVTSVTVTLQHNTTHISTYSRDVAEIAKMNPYQRAQQVLSYVCERLGSKPPSDGTIMRHLRESHPLQVLLKTYDVPTCGEMYIAARKPDGSPLGWAYVENNASALEAKLKGNTREKPRSQSVAERAMKAIEGN